MTDLSTNLGKLTLQSCIMNGACPLSSSEYGMKKLDTACVGTIITKTCTINKKEGNQFPTYYAKNTGEAINSIGLKNPGFRYYFDKFKSNTYSKHVIISVAGETKDILHMIQTGFDTEINISCPNINKKIIGYDPILLHEFLLNVFGVANSKQIIGLKLPPYLVPEQIICISSVLKLFPLDYVVCSNTLGGGLMIDYKTEQTRIHPSNGHGGISGIKHISLGNVRKFSKLLPTNISIVGCGGIKYGSDIFEYILAGASAVQVSTQYMEEGIDVFKRLDSELRLIMHNKKYHTIYDFKSKLKVRPSINKNNGKKIEAKL